MYRIYCLYANWDCKIRFRSYDDAYRYAVRNGFTRSNYLSSKFGIKKVDEYGNENSFDRWEI